MKSSILMAVDDKPDNLYVLEQLIAEYCPGCKVITAQNAEKGLQLAREIPLDIAIIDVQMPGMDGIEMCRRLKSDEQTAHIPVLLLTAHKTSTSLKIKGLEAGADDFISKPIDNIEVVAKIKVLMRIKAAEDILRRDRDNLGQTVHEQTRQLQEAEQQYQIIFNGASDAIFIHESNGSILEVNDEACRRLGYSREELLRMSLEDIDISEQFRISPEHVPSQDNETDEKLFSETVQIAKDSRAVPTELSSRMITYKGKHAILSIARDITERKQVERTLRDLNARYLAMFENMLNGVAVLLPVNNGENFIFVDFNKAAEKIDQLRREQVIGKSITDIFPGIKEFGLFKVLKKVNRTGSPEQHPAIMYKDERISGWRNNFVYKLPSGELVTIYSDETEQIMARIALVDSEIRYRTLFDSANDGIFVRDFKGRILDVNRVACEYLGYTREELLEMTTMDIISPEMATFVKERVEKLIELGSMVFETAHKHKDGTIIPIEVSSRVIEFNQQSAMLSIARDIRDRKQAEEERERLENQLRQAHKQQAIGTLAGGIAHDFNNILFPIMGYTEMTLDEVPRESAARKNLEEVLKSANRAKALVQQILTFSRHSKHEFKPLKVEPIIKEALKLLRATLPTTIEIRQNLDNTCNPVKADPIQIHQIIMNLCTNAYHAMIDNGGILDVTLTEAKIRKNQVSDCPDMEPGNYLKLCVKDSGHGMPRDVMERIFDPYFTTKEKDKGTGLGLSVVHGIIRNHYGHISVSSQPEKGTVFDIYLPVIESAPEDGRVQIESVPGGDEHILLVDDEEDVIRMQQMMLEHLGYRVTAVNESPDALRVFRSQPGNFDLVITDMTMPGMTGIRLATEIINIQPGMPIIMCSGFNEKLDEETIKNTGICEFLMKPVVRSNIAQSIRRVLDNSKARI